MGKYITPAALPPGTFFARRLLIPEAVDWLAIVNGALLDLTYASSFEQIDGISPQDTADAFFEMWQAYVSEDWSMIGAILPYATASVPPNCLPCDGATFLRVDYPALYAALDSAYVIDADHARTPDLRGRSAIGSGQGTGLSDRVIGQAAGEETHTLTTAEMPSHSHSYQPPGTTVPVAAPGEAPVAAINIIPSSTGSAGSDGAHNNMSPFHVVGYCIIAR